MLLVTGINGLLGQSIARWLVERNESFVGLGRGQAKTNLGQGRFVECDLSDLLVLQTTLAALKPTMIIHAAAYTAVDRAEVERTQCWQMNVAVTASLAAFAAQHKARMVHVSTDYVFGSGSGPHREDSPLSPRGVYAQSKAAGELAVQSLMAGNWVIARTSVPYGGAEGGKVDFARWLVGELRAKRPVRIVEDQISNPTPVGDLAHQLLVLARNDFSGIIHTAGATSLNRFQFAQAIAKVFALDQALISPIMTADLKQAAPRPRDASLEVTLARQLGLNPKSVDEGLAMMRRAID